MSNDDVSQFQFEVENNELVEQDFIEKIGVLRQFDIQPPEDRVTAAYITQQLMQISNSTNIPETWTQNLEETVKRYRNNEIKSVDFEIYYALYKCSSKSLASGDNFIDMAEIEMLRNWLGFVRSLSDATNILFRLKLIDESGFTGDLEGISPEVLLANRGFVNNFVNTWNANDYFDLQAVNLQATFGEDFDALFTEAIDRIPEPKRANVLVMQTMISERLIRSNFDADSHRLIQQRDNFAKRVGKESVELKILAKEKARKFEAYMSLRAYLRKDPRVVPLTIAPSDTKFRLNTQTGLTGDRQNSPPNYGMALYNPNGLYLGIIPAYLLTENPDLYELCSYQGKIIYVTKKL